MKSNEVLYIEPSKIGGWLAPIKSQKPRSGVVTVVRYDTVVNLIEKMLIDSDCEKIDRLEISQSGIKVYFDYR